MARSFVSLDDAATHTLDHRTVMHGSVDLGDDSLVARMTSFEQGRTNVPGSTPRLDNYISQNDQAKRLLAMLHRNHGKDDPDNLGYDATFYALFDRFSADEAELQGMIRSTTMNSQRRVNQALSEWLQTAAAFKRGDQPSAPRLRLSQQLLALELHLNQWHDKYEAWMPNDNKVLAFRGTYIPL